MKNYKRILPHFVFSPDKEWITEKQMNEKKLKELTFLINLPISDGTVQEQK